MFAQLVKISPGFQTDQGAQPVAEFRRRRGQPTDCVIAKSARYCARFRASAGSNPDGKYGCLPVYTSPESAFVSRMLSSRPGMPGRFFMDRVQRCWEGMEVIERRVPRGLVGMGPVGFEPTTKGFTWPRRFRREWTISSPVHQVARVGAGRSCACY